MAEGWAKKLKENQFEAYSAGIEKHGLNPLAVKAMAEAEVDITYQKSKNIDESVDLRPFRPISSLCEKNNPRNIKHMSPVIFFTCLDIERKLS